MRTAGHLRYPLGISLGILLLSVAAVAQAQIVTTSFLGQVQSVSGPLGGVVVSVGDFATGSLSYDLSVLDANAALDQGLYAQSIPGGITMVLGGKTITADAYPVVTRDFNGNEALEGISNGGLSVDGSLNSVLRGGIEFRSAGDILASDALPAVVPPFAEWLAGGGSIRGFLQDTRTFDLVTFHITPVPEPATFLLLGLGLPGVRLLRRRACKV